MGNVISWVVDKWLHDPVYADLVKLTRVRPVKEYWKFTEQRNAYARSFYEKVNNLGFHLNEQRDQ